ncbi:amino acid adenylation domain-containing protein, partial [Pseudoalteromonas sp. MMG006]|uniref:non-ribosomal peptide synthetase n=1 Tax=Pseudoalteromonas sp. MMG006 TaxID=2822683 RepID=UPI001B39A0CF
MIALELIKSAKEAGIFLFVEQNQLKFKLISDVFPQRLKEEIVANKQEIIALLSSEQARNTDIPTLRKAAVSNSFTDLSYSQRRIWFIEEMQPENAVYNMSMALDISGRVDAILIEQTLQKLIEKHNILRTVYFQKEGRPYQQVQKSFNFCLELLDLSEVNTNKLQNSIDDIWLQRQQMPFDLSSDLMLRACLLKTDELGLTNTLIIDIHHIACDGLSMEILLADFVGIYQKLESGAKVEEDNDEVQYSDFIHWQKDWVNSGALDAELDYWKGKLKNAPVKHSLPRAPGKKEAIVGAGKEFRAPFSASLSEQIRILAQQENVTVFMLLHAVIAYVFCRHANSEEILIGTPVANRLDKSLNSVVGCFINTVVLRTHTNFDRFDEYIQAVKDTHLDAQNHQALPFNYLVDNCDVKRSAEHTPLFQIIYSSSGNQQQPLHIPGLKISERSRKSVSIQFDLDITFRDNNDEIALDWIFDESLFSSDRIKQFSCHIENVLNEIILLPKVQLKDILMLSQDEVVHQTQQLNAAHAVKPSSSTIDQMIARHAADNPDNIAVVANNESLSYAQLEAKSDLLAQTLTEQGVNSGDIVSVCLTRNVNVVVAFYAVLKAGAVYLPIDPSLPTNRIQYILEDAGVDYLVTDTDVERSFTTQMALQVTNLSGFFNKGLVASFSRKKNLSKDLAYIIYTSGTTGKPKGVMIEHGSIAIQFYAWQEAYELSTKSRNHLQMASVGFDVCVGDFVRALCSGGKLVLCPKETLLSPSELLTLIHDEQIQIGEFVPAVLRGLLGYTREAGIAFPNFSYLIVGSDSWSLEEHANAQSLLAKTTKLVNSYGVTECTVDSTIFNSTDVSPESFKGANIGWPMHTAKVLVLNEFGLCQPLGSVGELCIGGPTVSRGYLNKPQLTKQKFIDFPHPSLGVERLYRTGDLARFCDDGSLEFLGRQDDQVKINGFRIELAEIEHHLIECSGVHSALVIANTDPDTSTTRLIAYVKKLDADIGEIEFEERLHNKLKDHLAPYMLPSVYCFLSEWPLNGSGKVDKKALPLPTIATQTRELVLPRNETESKLVDVIATLLNKPLEQISVTDNFFQLGGDSILSIQLVSRAQQKGLSITVKQLFNALNIAQLAAESNSQIETSAIQELIEGEMQLLPIQQLFFADESGLNHDNQAVALNYPEDLSVELLTEFATKIVSRHDVLRTVFFNRNGEWQAKFNENIEQIVQASVLKKRFVNEDTEEFAAFIQQMQSSLSPLEGQLFKLVMLQFDNGQAKLLLIFHHLVIDGVSWRILLEDLQSLYQQYKDGNESRLAAKTSAYKQWSEFLSSYNEAIDGSEIEFWHQTANLQSECFTELETTKLFNHERISGTSIKLDKVVTDTLLTQCNRKYRTEINELLLSALCFAVSSKFGQGLFKIDLEGHGREPLDDKLDLTQTMGWFTTIFPFAFTASEVNIEQIIIDVKERLRAIPNNGIGYGVLKYFGKSSNLRNTKNSELIFNYLGQFDQVSDDERYFSPVALNTGISVSPERVRTHPLSLNGMIVGGQLEFNLTFPTDGYCEAKMSAFMELFQQGLQLVVSHCSDGKSGRLSQSDFQYANLDAEDFAADFQDENIEDVFVATGMQQGMLFHSHLGDESYATQTKLTFGSIDTQLFRTAWQQLIKRHQALRSGFVQSVNGEFHQVVYKSIEPTWRCVDLSTRSVVEAKKELLIHAEQEKQLCTSEQQIVPFRFLIAALSTGEYEFIWTAHHTLLDGWCLPTLFSELTEIYGALCQNRMVSLPAPVPYSEYIRWLSNQDLKKASEFWLQQVSAITDVTPAPLKGSTLTRLKNSPLQQEQIVHKFELDLEQTLKLNQFAQQKRTTINVIAQAVWSVLLARLENTSNITFGAVTSGRPTELAGVEDMIGLFINSYPVHVCVDKDQRVSDWLIQLHTQLIEREEFNFVPLNAINKLSNSQGNLFNSLLVFENYPVNEEIGNQLNDIGLDVRNVEATESNNFPLTISFLSGERLQIKFDGKSSLYDAKELQYLGQCLTQLLIDIS